MIHFNSKIFSETEGVYVIGGSIRDLLLDRIPTDYDIAVTGNPKKFAEKIAKNISGRLVKLGKPGQMIIRVVSNDNIFDITSLNGSFIEDDLKKRDFTINAMAVMINWFAFPFAKSRLYRVHRRSWAFHDMAQISSGIPSCRLCSFGLIRAGRR